MLAILNVKAHVGGPVGTHGLGHLVLEVAMGVLFDSLELLDLEFLPSYEALSYLCHTLVMIFCRHPYCIFHTTKEYTKTARRPPCQQGH